MSARLSVEETPVARLADQRVDVALTGADLMKGRSSGVSKIRKAMQKSGASVAVLRIDGDRSLCVIRLPGATPRAPSSTTSKTE